MGTCEMTIENLSKEVSEYLLGSMNEADRDVFEERLLSDESFYFQVVDAENELIDRYVANRLEPSEMLRFEVSFGNFPGRRRKVENAKALRTYIDEQEPQTVSAEGFFSRLTAIFASQFATPAYAMAATIIVLTASIIFLVSANRERSVEISNLKNELSNTGNDQVDGELAGSKQRIEELQAVIDGERDTTGDLSSDLQQERESRRRLENEIAGLRNTGQADTRPKRDGSSVSVMRLDERSANQSVLLEPDTESERLSILISLPVSVKSDERVSIQLYGNEIARNVAVRSVAKGLEVNATVMTDRLAAGENVVTVYDSLGNQIAKYSIGNRGKEAPERK
jgi:hypothetical protein